MENESSGKRRIYIPTPSLQLCWNSDSPFLLDSSATRCKVVMRVESMQCDAPNAKPKILYDDPANKMQSRPMKAAAAGLRVTTRRNDSPENAV
jgi:hypothetical protein